MKIAIIEWNDSFFTHGWKPKDEFKSMGAAPCVSLGVIVNSNKDSVTLVLSLGRDDYADSMTIPRGCIKRIRYLRVKGN